MLISAAAIVGISASIVVAISVSVTIEILVTLMVASRYAPNKPSTPFAGAALNQ